MALPNNPTIAELITYYNEQLIALDNLPAWYVAAFKTASSRNITLDDWNLMYKQLQNTLAIATTASAINIEFYKLIQDFLGTERIVKFLTMNETTTPDALHTGLLFFDKTIPTSALTYIHDYPNAQTQAIALGQCLYTVCKNASGTTISRGQPVYISGADGDTTLMALARANVDTPLQKELVGVATTTTLPNEFGGVTFYGIIKNIDLPNTVQSGADLSQIGVRTKLYLSTTQEGRYSLTEPPRPHAAIHVATILNFSVDTYGNASLFVYPTAVRTSAAGVDSQLSDEQPTAQITGDLWFQIDS